MSFHWRRRQQWAAHMPNDRATYYDKLAEELRVIAEQLTLFAEQSQTQAARSTYLLLAAQHEAAAAHAYRKARAEVAAQLKLIDHRAKV